jgi:hypothetical protein
MTDILQCLRNTVSVSTSKSRRKTGVPLATVRERLAGPGRQRRGHHVQPDPFENGKRIDAWQCRVSGYVPPLAPGRKAKPLSR